MTYRILRCSTCDTCRKPGCGAIHDYPTHREPPNRLTTPDARYLGPVITMPEPDSHEVYASPPFTDDVSFREGRLRYVAVFTGQSWERRRLA